MFIDHVVRPHGLPDSIVSDRGSIFVSRFWKTLSRRLRISQRLSTAFHPQTDGQTERMNQTIEQYLRIYSNYQQNNWADHLAVAEFAYNNARQATLKCTPFFANYGFNPRFSFNPQPTINSDAAPAAQLTAERLRNLHDDLVEKIKKSQNDQARYYDTKHKRIEFAVGDKVWLRAVNIKTQRPSKKLDWKKLGPFKIIERIGTQSYRLELPQSLKLHPVFHVAVLEPFYANPFRDRAQPPPPPIVVDSQTEYEVESILDSRLFRRRLQYLVKWKGYDVSENTWQSATDLSNSPRLIDEFHRQHPSRPHP
jgi:hypothetical protein